MATAQDRNPTHEAQEGLLYERCWQCRAVVPNGLVRRRKMKTGYSSGSHVGTGAAYTRLDHYEVVSLCGVCDDELTSAERQRNEASFRRWSWVGRLVGVTYGVLVLTGVGISLGSSLAIMLTHAYFRIIGRALLTMHFTSIVAAFFRYMPDRYGTQVIASWFIIWTGLILWQLWFPENRPWPFRKRHLARPSHAVNQEVSTPTAFLSHGGDTR